MNIVKLSKMGANSRSKVQDLVKYKLSDMVAIWIEYLTFLLWTVLILSVSSDKIKENMSDAHIITNLLEKILTSYLKNNQLIDGKLKQNTIFVPLVTTIEIEKAIKQKVKELKPMLQDSDHNNTAKRRTENNFKRERSDETTITELVSENKRRAMSKPGFRQTKQSNDTFQKKIENYKQLRKNITKLLDQVKAASSAKKLITRTLDEMLSLLIKRQCQINSVDITNAVKNTRKLMPELTNITLNMLRQPFNKVDFYDKTGNISEISDDILLQLLLPVSKLIDKYKLRCFFDQKENDVTKDKHKVIPLSPTAFDLDNTTKDPCESFIICTEELTDFLKVTYDTLKVTAINTFRNYVDMYHRDIKHETDDTVYTRDTVTTKLYALSNVTETKVKEIFLKELNSFMLDKNKRKTANILYINNFITATTNKTKCGFKRHLDRLMSALNSTFTTIKDDLTVNLRQDMDNLRELFSTKICSFFVRCNSIPSRTRRFSNRRSFIPRDAKNIYVKVQRSFADELKDSLPRFGEQKMNSVRGGKTSQSGNGVFETINRSKYGYFGYGNVTRTSVRMTTATGGIFSRENMLKEQF